VKFLIDNWMLIAVALSSAAMLLWPVLSGGGPGGITPDGAVQLINREKAVVNIPYGQLENKLAATVKNKSVPLILVCYSGARSSRAVAIAKKLGFEKTFSLSGGNNAWRAANLPIERA